MRYHHVQKSSSFKPSISSALTTAMESKTDKIDIIEMEIDISTFEPVLIQAFSKEIHEYNTEVELTFGETINFIEKLAAFVSNIDSYQMSDIISIVLSKKTVTNTQTQYEASKIDEKPVYVRSVVQLIYYSFLNYILNDYKYKD
eukprot:UN09581